MDKNRSTEIIPKKEDPVRAISKDTSWLPPWLFKHQDLINLSENAKAIDQGSLINRLNHINFMDKHILVHLYDPKNEESILLRAYPEPCLGKKLICRWSDKNLSGFGLENYKFLHILIDDGKSMILVPACLLEINGDQLSIELPVTSYAVSQRHARRYACSEVVVELIQSGFLARGELLDFSPRGFRMRLRPASPYSFHQFNSDELATLHLRHDQQIVFSGPCRCIRQHSDFPDREIVLSPLDKNINRYKKKQIRNPRQRLVPSPTLIFDHPCLRKKVQMEVSDISTSGFAVYEEADEGVLIPGMVIPKMAISFADDWAIKCDAQVIYRLEGEGKAIRCGFSILDMSIDNYSRLTHMLSKALDPHAYISCNVDTDALWEFFFETGFIYPKKYSFFKSNRDDLKETYRKLYTQNPEIVRHLTYQKNGRIYGHISMVRAYERAWMLHHHAARALDNKKTGLMALKQIMLYLNDMYRLPSANIEYVFCYFRPENKFPDRVFGGFARALEHGGTSSLDLFSYLLYPTLCLVTQLPEGWSFQECSNFDLWELSRYYERHSGGHLLDILRLGHKNSSDESIEAIYGRLDFVRKCKAFSLNHEGHLKAVLIVNQSSLGLNLSELLNCIKILVTDSESLPWEVLSAAINQLAGVYETERVPILINPSDYLETKNVPFETKKYMLWIHDARFISQFIEFAQRKFRMDYWK